jgi:hypothetical protein
MADENTETLTLTELRAALPTPPAALVATLLADLDKAELVALGAQIASERVLVDDRRIYGLAHAFLSKATDAQKDALVGFSGELLAVAVHQALALEAALAASSSAGSASSAARDVASLAAKTAFTRGVGARDQAVSALMTFDARDKALRERVKRAAGVATNAMLLEDGLKNLGALADELVAHTGVAIAERARLARVTSAFGANLRAHAAKVKETSDAAGNPKLAQAAGGELNFLDGVNLHFLGDVIHVFEAAHDVDPTIPRLVPISTRRLLGKRARAAASADDVAPVPVAPS